MSMPPQGPGGPPNNNPYGSGGMPQGAWNQNQAQPYPDPHQQQYDGFNQPIGDNHQPGSGSEQMYPQGAYQQPPLTSTMAATNGPAGPGWNQPPKNNSRLPWIVGAAIVAIGVVVSVVILVTGKDDDKSAEPSPTTNQSQTEAGSGESDEDDIQTDDEPISKPTQDDDEPGETEPANDTGTSGTGTLPASIPVPANVLIDYDATYCSGNSCFAVFDTADPVAAYEDWIAELESDGYTVIGSEISGSGASAVWSIEASGDVELAVMYASGGLLTSF